MSPHLKQAFISILIGALVAFLTAALEGLTQLLNGYGNHAAGGVVSTIMYAIRTRLS